MSYKRLATAIYLCITLITLSVLVKAEQTASFNPSQYQSVETSRLNTRDSAVQTASTVDSRVTPSMLDSIWILSFTIAGLVLLRKVQGE
jgi:hypothetical protein